MKKIPKFLYYIIKDNTLNAYLGRDNKLHHWKLWGTAPFCVKTYKSLGWATRKAEQLGLNSYSIIYVYEDTPL